MKFHAKKHKVPDLALEPWTLFDAAFAVDVTDELIGGNEQTHPVDTPETQHSVEPDRGSSDDHDLFVIDRRVENADAIIAALPKDAVIFQLNTSEDGFSQINALARNHSQFDSIHIFAHGGDGFMLLGEGLVTAETMLGHQAHSLMELADHVNDQADILIYGCNFAGGENGKAAAGVLAALTGADIAASEDVTGSQSAGGDWHLEFETSNIEAASVEVASFHSTLAVEATDGVFTVQDSETPSAGTIALSNDGAGLTTTTMNTPRGVQSMVQQVWSYQETGDVGRSTIVIDASSISGTIGSKASDFALIISDQADLSGEDTSVLRASGYDASGGLVYFHKVNIADGDYVGVATQTETDNISIDPVIVANEDEAVDLNIVVQPALTDGGSLPDTFATATGFRPHDAGTTPTAFLIPAGTTSISITGYSSLNNFAGGNASVNDDYQTMNVSINLANGLSDGVIAHIIDQGPSRNTQFSWTDVPLGSGVLDAGSTQGYQGSVVNPVFSIVDGELQIVENTGLQTAYFVEFANSLNSSANFLGSSAALLDIGHQDDVVIDIPDDADYIKINQNDAAAGNDYRIEYKGFSAHFLDLTAGVGSGTVMAQHGSGENRTVTYAYEGYDFSSSSQNSIQSSDANLVGDTNALQEVNNDLTYYINADGDLVIKRASGHADGFNTMLTIDFYDRLDIGSSADAMGSDADRAFFDANPTSADAVLSFTAPEGAKLGLLNLSMGGTSTNDLNENMGSGFVVIDLENGTTSGSMFNVRVSNKVDLLSWSSVPEGTNMFAVANGTQTGGNASSNHADVNQFNDRFIANGVFEFEVNDDNTTTVEFITNSTSGNQSYLDYNAFAQVQWLGSAPLKLPGLPEGGSFNIGERDPDSGDWQIDINQLASEGLTFTPPSHFSGNLSLKMDVSVGQESEEALIIYRPILDPISFTTIDVTGDEDTQISLSDAVLPTFIDDDGSETATATVLSNITIGHIISDGINTFTATTGSQSVDISSWDNEALTYFAGDHVFGDFNMTVTIDYIDTGASQTVSGSSTATLTIHVLPANDPPDAVNDQYILIGGQTLEVTAPGILSNDSDVEGDGLAVDTTPLIGPSHGALTLNADGSFTYVHGGNAVPSDSFTYRVFDGNGGETIATVLLTISPAPEGPPDAIDDSVVAAEETALNINVLGNDTPSTGPLPIVQSVTQPINGSVTINPDGTVTYEPNQDFYSGPTDSFTYTIVDALGRTDTATVSVTVTNVQDPPTALPDNTSTPEDTAVNIAVLNNDSDADGDTLTIVSATSTQGSLVIEPDGTLTFTPNLDFVGLASIDYVISDGNGNSVSSSVAVTVTAQPDAPNSLDKTITIVEDSVYTLQPSDIAFSDADPGDALQSVSFSEPSVGTLFVSGTAVTTFPISVSFAQLSSNTVSYQPEPDGNGVGYATIEFRVNDGQLDSIAPNTLTFDVTSENDPIALSGTTLSDQQFADGDSDVSIQTSIAFVDVDDTAIAYTMLGAPDGLEINGVTGEITSTVDGIDHLASAGSPYNVTIEATSADGSRASTTFLIGVTNPAPEGFGLPDRSAADGGTVLFDLSSGFGDTAPDGDLLSFSTTSSLPPGLSLGGDGRLSGTLDHLASAGSPYVIAITATDEQGASITQDFTLTVTNPIPTVTSLPDVVFDEGEQGVVIAAGSAFSDPDGGTDGDALSFAVTGLPAGLSFDPATGEIAGDLSTQPNQNGLHIVTVTATDEQGASVAISFTIDIANVPPAVALDLPNQSYVDGVAITPFNLAPGFTDPGGGLSLVIVNGTLPDGLILNSAGVISGTPALDASQGGLAGDGIYTITVQATDAQSTSITQTLTLTVTNPAPTAGVIPDQTAVDGETVSFDAAAMGNFSDEDVLSYAMTGLPAGFAIDPATGVISGSFSTAASVNAPYTVTVTATDNQGGNVSQSFSWAVTNPAPEGFGLPDRSAADGDTVLFDLSSGFGDTAPDGDLLSFSTTSSLPPGLSLGGDGRLSGTLDHLASAGSPYVIAITATDEQGASITQDFTLTVTNPIPTVTSLPDVTTFDSANIVVNAGAAYSDPDGDALQFSATGLPVGLVIDPTSGVVSGNLSADASQQSPYAIAIIATDENGASVQSNFNLTVLNTEITSETISDVSVEIGIAITPIDLNVFSDPDGDILTLSVAGLLGGLTFDPQTGFLTGTIANDVLPGVYAVEVTATDNEGSSNTVSFLMTVQSEDSFDLSRFRAEAHVPEHARHENTQIYRTISDTVLLQSLDNFQKLGLFGNISEDTPTLDTADKLNALMRNLPEIAAPHLAESFQIPLALAGETDDSSDLVANVYVGEERTHFFLEMTRGESFEIDNDFAPHGVRIASEGGVIVEKWVFDPFTIVARGQNRDGVTFFEILIDPQQIHIEIISIEARDLLASERLRFLSESYQ